MDLPPCKDLDVSKLTQIFNNTSATYKFYWFLAIIDSVENNQREIFKKDLFIKMLSIPWYTVNYFNLSFGSQDLIHDSIKSLVIIEDITVAEKQENIQSILNHSSKTQTNKLILHFNKNVPHWFLSPWFKGKKKREIYSLSANYKSEAPYSLSPEKILIKANWFNYLKTHSKFLKGFCYWHLALFLQVRNPNVPDIPNKLIRPATRNSLIKQRNQYWNKYLDIKKSVPCIFTGKMIDSSSYSLDHFIPYAFISHDLIWNLIPIDTTFNLQKSDKLPSLKLHYDKFFNLQKDAFFTFKREFENKKYVEEYHSIFPILETEEDFSSTKFKDVISPLITTARNNGFETFEERRTEMVFNF